MEGAIMIIEVIADTLSDALSAQQAGADRIELVTGLVEGGLTPSYGVIERVCSELTIPVNVMIRPHSRGFCYTVEDIEIMKKDMEVCQRSGAAGVVFGALTRDNTIDEDVLKELISASENLDITFHRAFDEVENQLAALEVIEQFPQISRILTSGGKSKAVDAIDRFQVLVNHAKKSNLQIMAGAGLSIGNAAMFIEKVEVNEIHFGTGVRYQSSYSHAVDPLRVQEVKRIVSK
jgi:copper homeostasis protein